MNAVIRPLGFEDAQACDAIIASLPGFFGLDQGIRACQEAVRSQPGLVAVEGGSVRAFLTFARHFGQSAEITWMATHADHRHQGLGGALIEELATILAAEGRSILLVLTLAPSDPLDEPDGYGATRRFYQRHGFVLSRELPELWDENVAVLLVRPLLPLIEHLGDGQRPSA